MLTLSDHRIVGFGLEVAGRSTGLEADRKGSSRRDCFEPSLWGALIRHFRIRFDFDFAAEIGLTEAIHCIAEGILSFGIDLAELSTNSDSKVSYIKAVPQGNPYSADLIGFSIKNPLMVGIQC